ncbi:tRNA (adenosine(37)-N6)-threonylcarbamoyltransferase complex dimerization subunit type 1 TsaB [Candidatus Parabeggiatoa sp. HSG14]|uniref:tRNA (adenosine(37)-N6)-threonylcarbamoyltransferase complex dimerization subunit type 1 TsaB n=1 Tax=Candidatus Parabeggiatoa sp. HSG14 TaxID=3055593 RepID=UPI0025A83EC0|nr:tRNA (adenosine(37)-N6)-threonylcarbamoyltransferase complex dimerization subunit type 1 TsaB [Thiotrichales bacterium HSG14]
MKLLVIDTATEACSCALYLDGEIQDRYVIAPRQHTSLILPMADELLAEAGLKPTQLEGIAFGCGPGSFTGLRIACGVVQGIAFAADIPVAPISSLAALAQATYTKYGAVKVLAAIDARMHEVYWGRYKIDDKDIMRCESKEIVCAPNDISLPSEGQWYGVGTGWATYAENLKAKLGKMVQDYQGKTYPQASAMIPLALAAFQEGKIVSAEDALPVYLRNKVVQTRS